MSQSETIRNGLVTALQPLLAANGGPIGQITAYALSSPTPPVIYVTAGETQYDLAMVRGGDMLTLSVVALVAQTLDIPSQQLLDELRDATGSTSVKTLIEADRTLGGACQSAHVTKVSRPQLYETPGQPSRLGCEWTVEIYT